MHERIKKIAKEIYFIIFGTIKLNGDTKSYDIDKVLAEIKEYEPRESEYGWVYDYSMVLYDKASVSIYDLEKKAEMLLKFLAPITGIISIVLTYVTTNNNLLYIFVIIGIAFIVISMVICLKALSPSDFALPPSTMRAINRAEKYNDENKSKVKFATSIWLATTKQLKVIDYKSRHLYMAYFISTIGFVWILLSIPLSKLIIVICR